MPPLPGERPLLPVPNLVADPTPAAAALSVSVRVGAHAGHRVLALAGDLVADTTALLRSQLGTDGAGSTPLLLDLGGLQQMDANGLAVLVDARHQARRSGYCLHLVAGTAVTRLIIATGLYPVLAPRPTRDTAVAGCPQRPGS